MMAIFSKFAKSHSSQINKAQKWIDNAQATFADAIEEAKVAESKFDEVTSRAETEIAELQAILDDTNDRKAQAVKFKQKMEDFMN